MPPGAANMMDAVTQGVSQLGQQLPPAAMPEEAPTGRHICLHFRVPFWTVWGQSLVVCGEGKVLGKWDPLQGLRMSCHHVGNELLWEAQVSVPYVEDFSYRYAVLNDGREVVKQEKEIRSVHLHPKLHPDAIIAMWDEWQPGGHVEKIFATSAYTEAIFAGKGMCEEPIQDLQHLSPEPGTVVVQFSVSSYRIQKGQVVVVTGSAPQLGSCQPQMALELTRTGDHTWQGEAMVPVARMPITYKYAIKDKGDEGQTMKLERGESRIASIFTGESQPLREPLPAVAPRHDGCFNHTDLWKGAGLAVPVFSLRTKKSVGVGEFRDIKALVDVCKAAGMRMAQLLPINDTSVYMTQWDSYPYCSLSVYALHPQYLCLEELSGDLPPDIQTQIEDARTKLDLIDVDYPGVMEAKRHIAKLIFDLHGDATLKSAAFADFMGKHNGWLRPYAAFCFLRDVFGTSEHWKWGTLAHPKQSDIDRLTSPRAEHYDIIRFTYYIQFHLHCQLYMASQYAALNRVALKGDLPIGVDKRSVDTWLYPKLFRMNKSTGAPPDVFDPNGQNWGFPTYVWEEMAKDGYAWWRSRLSHMAQYFHAYRIDHILGFFRIWEIPGDETTAALGSFRPSLALTRGELEAAGVWDFDRLTKPFVSRETLKEMFGTLADDVACKFFQECQGGLLCFSEQYQSETAIKGVSPRPGSPTWLVEEVQTTRKGLLELRKNVILLVDETDGDKFYPRFGMEGSSSWRYLDEYHKTRLESICQDFFHGRQDALWESNALKTIPVLMGATNMLVFGEDLGFVPSCVPPVLADLGLFGLRIQRMSSEENQAFGDPAKYPYMTVASPSCHDTTTTRGWWEEDGERRLRFYNDALGGSGTPPDTCEPTIIRQVIRQHAESSSAWAVFPIQDVLALSPKYATRPAKEETINDPTNPKHYWRYRMHVNLEDIADDAGLMDEVQAMLRSAGRTD